MIKTKSEKLPNHSIKVNYSNFIDVIKTKFPRSCFAWVRLRALYSGIAFTKTRQFSAMFDAFFVYNKYTFNRSYDLWYSSISTVISNKLDEYDLPSFEDDSKDSRILNTCLIEDFLNDNMLYREFVNLKTNILKGRRFYYSESDRDFIKYINYYHTACIKLGILKNDNNFIEQNINSLKADLTVYQTESNIFNAVFAVLGYCEIDENWLNSRTDYIKNLFYNAAVYGFINYAYYDKIVFSKPFDEKIFSRFESFNAPLILKALRGDRSAAIEFIEKEKNGQRKEQKLSVLQNKITLGILYNLNEPLVKIMQSYDKTIKDNLDTCFEGRNFGGVCACLWYLKNGTVSQKSSVDYIGDSVYYNEFQVEKNLGNGLSGFFTIKALSALNLRKKDVCKKHISRAESPNFYRISNFFDVMLLIATKIRCGMEISESQKNDLLDVYRRLSDFPVVQNICSKLIIKSNLYSQKELKNIQSNSVSGEEPFDLTDIVPDVPEWKYKLDNLIEILKVPSQDTFVPSPKENKEILWVVKEDGLMLSAFEKNTDLKGGVHKGKAISLYQLIKKQNELSFLSKDDLLLINELERIYNLAHDKDTYWRVPDWISSKEVLTKKIIHTLHSIKGLYIEKGDSILPLKITRSPLKCDLSEAKDEITISLDKDLKDRLEDKTDSDGEIIVKKSDDELIWYHIGEKESQAAKFLFGGITLPKKELNTIIPLCYGNQPVLSISGEVNSSEITASHRIVIQMEHKNDGFYGLVGVKPFGREKSPLYTVASGPESPIYNFIQQANSDKDKKDPPLNTESMTTVKCHRDFASEKAELDKLLNTCPTFADNYENGYLSIYDLETTLKLLEELEQSEAEYSLEWAKGNKIKVTKPIDSSSVHLKITKSKSAGEWFAISGNLEIDKEKALSIQALLNSLSGSRFVEIKDGEYITLTEKLRKKLATLKMLTSEEKGNDLQVNALVTQAVEQSIEGMDVETEPVWDASVERMKKAFSSTPEIPKGLQAQLRDYQVEGYEWMQRLAIWGVGACLADDMGLGKTLQTIAVMLNQAKEGPCLILAPTSVGQNWKQEVERFAPSLRIKRFEARGREALVKSLRKNDVLIVGYGLLKNVEKYLTAVSWSMVVFDEAQALKNFDTKRAKVSKKIPANFRVALTGTPIENRIEDLWALFNNINPGLLGSWDRFHEKFKNIEPGSSSSKALKTMIKPFLLRRLKSNVLDELPSRTEQNLMVEMNDAEKVFYEELRSSIVNELEHTDARNKKFQILASLTKLRRACCHPQLANADMENLESRSSKIDRFIEILKNLIDGGHKVLAFSQFTSFLSLIEKALKEENISYQYLDGQTPEKEREKRIENFQNGDGDVFLLSLKAGGTGINLTAADYVVHLDPWWNPAVEDQASDRAHRLGQKRPVTIYRLVAENTVEEKILALHAQKRELAADFLEGTSSSVKQMTEDELMALLKA